MDYMGSEQDKWSQPGWKIERKYTNKVLLGNWAEERFQFTREPKIANTTAIGYRLTMSRPLCVIFQGLPSKLLFAHHGSLSSHYLVTHYEESYGRKHTHTLPTPQPWHPDSLTWQLERSDRPISGTNKCNFCILTNSSRRPDLAPGPHVRHLCNSIITNK
uniref:Si:ch211-226m7.4 n=1 Tax=Sphaeramia orbicularis TaxID=375764 RepID=A0A673CDF0_9TELE